MSKLGTCAKQTEQRSLLRPFIEHLYLQNLQVLKRLCIDDHSVRELELVVHLDISRQFDYLIIKHTFLKEADARA